MSSHISAASLLLLVLSTTTLFGCGGDTPIPPDGGKETECIAGESRCDGLVPESCDDTGKWVAADACEFVCAEGTCTGACVPGSQQCDELVPETCDDTGTWVAADACEFMCAEGSCTGACVPGSQQCDELVPETCDDTGKWVAADACDFVCDAGSCTGACVPGDGQCEGLVPETCDATGTWVAADACDFVCAAGSCTGACVPGDTQCDGLVPETCDATGTWVAADACDFVCDAGSCTGVCSPGAAQCDGLVPETCDATGAWVAADACDFVCAAGSCTGVCAPGATQCDGLVPSTCDATGTWVAADACDFVCGAGSCTGVCSPGATKCDGLVPETCDATGTWVAADACDFVCAAGSCTGVCVPGSQQCSSATALETCDAMGQWGEAACPQSCSARTNTCVCDPGYFDDGTDCTPIDFCSAPNGGCSPNATCSQTDITPSCACNAGFEGDGYSCSVTTTRLDEGFDNIGALSTAGWSLENRSAPIGITGWFQGTHPGATPAPGPFDSFDGAANAYIGANYNSTGGAGTISNWMVTPPVDFGARASMSFFTRRQSVGPKYFADRIEVRACPQLPCDLPGNANTVGGYSTLLGTVNPDLVPNGYPGAWTSFEYTNALGIPWSGRGHLAIRYFVTNAGPSGTNSDYIGIDRLVVRAGAPSYAVAGSVTGLADAPVVLWLNGNELVEVASNGAFAFTQKLDSGTPWSVTVFTQPEDRQCIVTNGVGTIDASNVGDVLVTCGAY